MTTLSPSLLVLQQVSKLALIKLHATTLAAKMVLETTFGTGLDKPQTMALTQVLDQAQALVLAQVQVQALETQLTANPLKVRVQALHLQVEKLLISLNTKQTFMKSQPKLRPLVQI